MNLKRVGCEGLDWIYLSLLYEHDNDTMDSIKGGQCHDYMCSYQLLDKQFDPQGKCNFFFRRTCLAAVSVQVKFKKFIRRVSLRKRNDGKNESDTTTT